MRVLPPATEGSSICNGSIRHQHSTIDTRLKDTRVLPPGRDQAPIECSFFACMMRVSPWRRRRIGSTASGQRPPRTPTCLWPTLRAADRTRRSASRRSCWPSPAPLCCSCIPRTAAPDAELKRVDCIGRNDDCDPAALHHMGARIDRHCGCLPCLVVDVADRQAPSQDDQQVHKVSSNAHFHFQVGRQACASRVRRR